MYISGINRAKSYKYSRKRKGHQAGKAAITYAVIAVFCVIFDRVYAQFGHGVISDTMDWMFLYPLIGGALPFLVFWWKQVNTEQYRLLYNAYNSGIAALTIGSALFGVFEIAGTSSTYTIAFFILGWTLCAAGLFGFAFTWLRRRTGKTLASSK